MTAHSIPITVHTRAQIGLRAPNTSRLAMRSALDLGDGDRGLTWHWTGADGRLFRPDPLARLRGIQSAHMAPGGLGTKAGAGDIAYAGAFDADANVYLLRDSKFIGAHALSPGNVANAQTNGIVFLEDARGVTPAALAGFTWWYDLFRLVHRGRVPEMFAHEYWARMNGQATTCPGVFSDVVRFCGGHV